MAKGRPPEESIVELDGRNSAESVLSVARDLAALIEVLERHLELVSVSDSETRTRISQAKAAAERGAQLSHELLKRIQTAD